MVKYDLKKKKKYFTFFNSKMTFKWLKKCIQRKKSKLIISLTPQEQIVIAV